MRHHSAKCVARVFKAMAHPTRVPVVAFLGGGERCVCEMQGALGLEQANTSRHLGVLRMHDIVRSRREGMRTFYSLVSPAVPVLLEVAARVAQVPADPDTACSGAADDAPRRPRKS